MQKLKPNMRIKVIQGSGLDSGKTGTVLSWSDPKAAAIRNEYPFVAGRTPEQMGWLAIELDGAHGFEVTALPASRIVPIGDGLVYPPFPPALL